jgi:NADP-reducing hydrogenase subunit HndC
LIESLEGKRGEPRIRPPYPASYGYHGKPTVVNNVESFAYVPEIGTHGGNWYLSIGDPTMPGTKLFTLLGHINRPGLFEAPYGITLREAIEGYGDGMTPGSEFQFALTGGAAGTIVSREYLDTPIGSSSTDNGITLGSGAILICDQSVAPVAILREILYFFEVESCGKCTPCRIGTRDARIILDQIIAGNNSDGDKKALLSLAAQLKETSFCGLGQSAAMPIASAIRNFEQLFL